MVLVGFFCVLGAIGLLIAGFAQADPSLVWASIAASAVGGLAVFVAAIQRGRAVGKAEAAAGRSPPPMGSPTPAVSQPIAGTEARRPGQAGPTADKTPSAAADLDEESPVEGALEKAAPEKGAPDVLLAGDSEDSAAVSDDDVRTDDTDDTDEIDEIDEIEVIEDPDPAKVGELVDAVVMGDDRADDLADDPADEPAEEDVDMADLLTVIELDEAVLIVDLRPRYHLEGCEHLRHRESLPLPVNEARKDGFTPCRLCRPDATLAASARRVRSANT